MKEIHEMTRPHTIQELIDEKIQERDVKVAVFNIVEVEEDRLIAVAQEISKLTVFIQLLQGEFEEALVREKCMAYRLKYTEVA